MTTMLASKPSALDANMYFLADDPLYNTDKPYSLRFPPGGDLPQTNVKREKHAVQMHSIRDLQIESIEDYGFQLIPFQSSMQYVDWDDEAQIRSKYLPEVSTALKCALGARHVHVLDFAVRRRETSFPISTGENYSHEQPTALVHIDFTVQEGERLLQTLYDDGAKDLMSGRWQLINLWKPLKGPLNDWPLGLCDARSLNHTTDTMPGDVVYDEFVAENVQVFHRDIQQWYYLPDQLPSEALIFKSADSDPNAAPGCPHAGFYNPTVRRDEQPRESVDIRAFVFYADLESFPAVKRSRFDSFTPL